MSIFRPTRRSYTAEDVLTAAQRLRTSSSNAGQLVTRDTVNAMPAVWRCKHLLADIIAGLPYHEYADAPDGSRERVPSDEFVASPSDFVRDYEWRYQMMMSALDVGNGFAYVTSVTPQGIVRRAEVLDPADVMVSRRDGALAPPTYKVNRQPVDASRILHLRAFGPMPGSVLGMSPLHYAAKTIGLGLAVREYGSDWYASGGHPTALLKTKAKLDDTAAREAKERFRAATQGDHLAARGGGWEYETVQADPDGALFLAAVNATAIDVCCYFGVPPEMLGLAVSGSSVTYANREQRALDLLTYTVQWWINRLEGLITEQLPRPRYVKANLDALLRTDLLTRYKAHDMKIRSGWGSRNEVRRIEDQAPLPAGEGDEYLWPPYRTLPDPAQTEGGPA